MDVRLDVHIHVHPARTDSDDSVTNALAYITALVQEVLEATVSDPVKLDETRQKIEQHTEALKAALVTNPPPKP